MWVWKQIALGYLRKDMMQRESGSETNVSTSPIPTKAMLVSDTKEWPHHPVREYGFITWTHVGKIT